MKRLSWFVMPALLGGTLLAQTSAKSAAPPASQQNSAEQQAEPDTASGKIGPAAVWQVPPDFAAKTRDACEKEAGNATPNDASCFIDRMAAAGASSAAVDFARMMYYMTDHDAVVVTDFHKSGPVDVIKVSYPLRKTNTVGMLLVNGDPPILDVDDLKLLDTAAMNDSDTYKMLLSKFPYSMLVAGDRASTFWPQAASQPNGNVGLIFGYPLLDGCRSCPHVGLARFSWNFDRHGKFLNASYIPTPPPPFKERQVEMIEAEARQRRAQEVKEGISQAPISQPPETPDATTAPSSTPTTTTEPSSTPPPPQL